MKVVHSVLARISDQLARRAFDVLGQDLDGGVRVPGERELLKLPVLARDVALVVVG